MTGEGVLALAILGAAVLLLVTEWIRYDLVAVLVLLALAVTGLVPGPEAIRGFGDPAVVTLGAALVLSGALYRTGVANLVGRHVFRIAGDRPLRLVVVTMGTAGLLSSFMFNVAAAALLLPVVVDVSRRIGQPPSRLLMPLSFGTLLGGTLTEIGTAPNILINGALAGAGLPPFHMFDFSPVGGAALIVGILYMVAIGRRLLPDRRPGGEEETGYETRGEPGLGIAYDFDRTLFTLTLPPGSGLVGRTLVESRLGLALGLSVLAVRRDGRLERAPETHFRLRAGDQVIAAGRAAALEGLRAWGRFRPLEGPGVPVEEVANGAVGLAEAEIAPDASIIAQTLDEMDFRNRFQAHVLAIGRAATVVGPDAPGTRVEAGDRLLLMGRRERLDQLRYAPEFRSVRSLSAADATERYALGHAFLRLRVPERSSLEGRTLEETRLGEAFDLTVLQVSREGGRTFLPGSDSTLEGGDVLLVEGRRDEFRVLEALQALEVRKETGLAGALEAGDVGFAEVTLSPRAGLVGQTLSEIFFREKYGLTVLAIWRGGRSYHSNVRLRGMPLQFGDGILVYGDRSKLRMLARDPDFLVLGEEGRGVFRSRRAPVALAVMAGVVVAAATGALPIYLAATAGALLMVVTGCLTADEAYGFIQWRTIVLIGGLLALGVALQESGAAAWIARTVVGRAASVGPTGVLGSLFLLTVVGSQIIPTAAVAVLMSPIALSTAATFGLSPHALLMAVVLGASAAFVTPFGHSVNLLVMGVGGYRVSDYARVGTPLIALLLLIVLFVLPAFWPLAEHWSP
ncbi:MAG: SLC13 family permease [Gemmatimonadota bacterium]